MCMMHVVASSTLQVCGGAIHYLTFDRRSEIQFGGVKNWLHHITQLQPTILVLVLLPKGTPCLWHGHVTTS